MTANYKSFFDKYKKDQAAMSNGMTPEDFAPDMPDVKEQAASPFQAGLQSVERAGGALLANVVKGVSVPGQAIMGALSYMEQNGHAQTSGENDKLTGFTWDNFKEDMGQAAAVFGGAARAGVGQAQTILGSKNLSEFGQNVVTGVDVLKALPGTSWFRDQDTKGGKFATGVAGFALEVLLDPTAMIGGAAYKGASKLATKGVEAGVLGERAADVMGRAAANAATGNWAGGAIAMTARESAFAAREKLVTLANKYATISPRKAKAVETILEWGMGPSALTTNASMRVALSKYAALKEDLPKDMLKVSNTTATMIAHLPQKQQEQAQRLFGQLAGASTREAEETAANALQRLGLDRKDAMSVGMQYRSANLRLMDVLKTASDDIPALKEISAGMSEYHIRRSYRMFVDPKVRTDWLDHLVKVNTPGSWQMANTNLRSQLDDALGVVSTSRTTTKLEPFDMNFASGPAAPGNMGTPPELFGRNVDKIKFSKHPSSARTQELENDIALIDKRMAEGGAGTDMAGLLKEKETLTQQVESLDKMTAGLGPNSFATPKIKRLQSQIDALDDRISTATESQLDKLTARRNGFQAQLENEIGDLNAAMPRNAAELATRSVRTTTDNVNNSLLNTPDVTAAEQKLAGMRHPNNKQKARAELAAARAPQNAAIDSEEKVRKLGLELDVLTRRLDTATNAGTKETLRKAIANKEEQFAQAQAASTTSVTTKTVGQVDTSSIGKAGLNGEDAFPTMRAELAGGPDRSVLPTLTHIKEETRHDLVSDLQKYMTENDDKFAQSGFVGFRQNEDGTFVADFAGITERARQTTLTDIGEFTTDWAKARGLADEDIEKINAAIHNSLTYIPGSREFATMVRERSKALLDLDPKMAQMLNAELALTKVDTKAMQDITLDPVWHSLFGNIDNFSVNAAQQGVHVGAVAAKANLLSELKQRGLVQTEKFMEENPDIARNGGWVPMDDAFSVAGDSTRYYIQASNKRSIAAIDRSLGDMNKMQAFTHASNLFRRAALGTDPSAHVTQMLGNLSMLQMMGLKSMFGDDVKLVQGMTHAFKSVMLGDELFKDAVDNGVMVTQTVLNGQQSQNLSRTLLTLPSMAQANGDKVGALTTLFRAAHDTFSAGTSATADRVARVATNTGANLLRNGGMEGTDAISAATHLASPSAMFQLPDQMTRLFAYRASMIDKTKQLVKANPTLANFTKNGGADINWEGALQHAQSGVKSNFTEETVKGLQQAHKLLKEESATLANDVALNYSDVPLAINYMSKTGIVPFIKFQWKATGRIMQFMDEKPWAFSPYYAAQRNLNDGLNPDPDHFNQQRESLSPTVRDALVIPTGGKDSMGRQEFIDLSRWLPFGMYAGAANGKVGEGGLAMQPNSIVSTPVLDVVHSVMNMDAEKQPGQSPASFIAQKLTETFAAAGVAPGGRKVETLARAIEQSMHYVDAEGNAHDREPTGIEKAITGYAAIPEAVGQGLTELGNTLTGNPTLTSASGTPKEQTADRPRTTVEQAYGRYLIPGVGFSADTGKTIEEYDRRYDLAINALKQQLGSENNNMGQYPSNQQLDRMEKIQERISQLEQLKKTKANLLVLGE
jgi:hypothetical protein